jgi:diphosphomevalonate decarboxylase
MIYWNSVTLACMQTIRNLQEDGVPVFFTIDAGPQIKAVCTLEATSQVHVALAETVGVEAVMLSGLGEGAALESTA